MVINTGLDSALNRGGVHVSAGSSEGYTAIKSVSVHFGSLLNPKLGEGV